jgi:CheY-like chemotaxis protein
MFTSAQTWELRCGGFVPGTGRGCFAGVGLELPHCFGLRSGDLIKILKFRTSEIMEPASPDRMPGDVLIVEDDPIIALDFEDTILGFGVKTVRTAGNVSKALEMISDRAPDFALLDVGLVREKSFAVAERLAALKIPFVFVTGYAADVRLPAAFTDRPRLPKPYSTDALQAALKR